ncbi:MAG: LuxR C-terminal-related transcriptional regulator [Ilumatobacteraceae bacterium]
MSVQDHIERICRQDLDDRTLRVAVLEEMRRAVPFDFYAWLLTDPETCVGSAPLAETPSLADLPRLIRLKYATSTNRWTNLESDAANTLVHATNGDRASSRMWTELLSTYSVDDVASIVFRDQYGCWAFLDLWRIGGTFSDQECAMLTRLSAVVTAALRRSLGLTFAAESNAPDEPGGPAVLLMSADIELLTQTPQTDAYLRALLPTDAGRSPVPAAAYNVAAQLLAREEGVDEHPALARVHLRGGLWVTLRAARIEQRSSPVTAAIAVSIEPTPPTARAGLYARVVGLSEREAELLHHLVGGHDTRDTAHRMFVSEHTVQDHLKSVFAKTGVNNRRMLIARATGVA